MKKANLIIAILNTLILFYFILAVILEFPILGIMLTAVGVIFSIFLVFLIIYLFKRKRTAGNVFMLILSSILLLVSVGGFGYNGVKSIILGNPQEILPTFVMTVYSIFTLFSWGVVLHLYGSE